MSTETPIRHILLIPSEGDPHGLLKQGLCGARPPTISTSHDGAILDYVYYGHEPLTDALVLAWKGEPVPEGCDRADRARDGDTVEGLYLLKSYTLENAIAIGAACEAVGFGRLVVVRS